MQEIIKKVPGFVSFTSMFDSLITKSVAVFKGIEEKRIGQEQTDKVNESLELTKDAFIAALTQQGVFITELNGNMRDDYSNISKYNTKVTKLNAQIEELKSLLDTGKVIPKGDRNNKEKMEAFMAERITSNKSKVQAIIKGMLELADDVKYANYTMGDHTTLDSSYKLVTKETTDILEEQLKDFNKAQNAQLQNNVRWVMRTLFGGLAHVTVAVVGIIVGVVGTVVGVTAAVALAVAKMLQVFMAAVVATIIFVGKFIFDMAFKVLPLLVSITASGLASGFAAFAHKGKNLKVSQESIENDWNLIKGVFVREKETLISTFGKLAALTTSISLEENKKASIDFTKEVSYLAGFSRIIKDVFVREEETLLNEEDTRSESTVSSQGSTDHEDKDETTEHLLSASGAASGAAGGAAGGGRRLSLFRDAEQTPTKQKARREFSPEFEKAFQEGARRSPSSPFKKD